MGLFLGVFLISFALAVITPNNIEASAKMQSPNTMVRVNASGNAPIIRAKIREKLKENEELTVGERLKIRKIAANRIRLKVADIEAETELELEENASKLRAVLSNGRRAEIKIMPDVASQIALRRLRLKNCNETRNCTIELKEVGEGNKTRLMYETRARKTFRLFGIFKNKEDISVQIDAETGEEIKTKRPWWAWMASEED